MYVCPLEPRGDRRFDVYRSALGEELVHELQKWPVVPQTSLQIYP
jgi:hypothetical protein